jgi:hypothetical protein
VPVASTGGACERADAKAALPVPVAAAADSEGRVLSLSRSTAASEQVSTRVTWSGQLERESHAQGADVPRAAAPKAPARPPLSHQRPSEETFGYSEWGFQPAVGPP